MSKKQTADSVSSAPSPEAQNGPHNPAPTLRPENQRMLALLAEWEKTPLCEEDKAILEDMEVFLCEHPFSLSSSSDK